MVRGAPQLQGRELLELARTWFGMCWPGNPRTIGIKVLYAESCATNAATVKLAELFVTMANGLEVFYEQYDHNYRWRENTSVHPRDHMS